MVKGIYKSSWWSIDLLPGWWTDEEPRCTTFFREDGVGALQISAYKTETVTIPETDLRDFTEGQFPDGIALQTVDCGEFSGNGVEYVADGKFWLKRWVSKGPLLLYITYNSDANPRNLESVDIGHMLDTLKALDVA
jgi:hypothetical protein